MKIRVFSVEKFRRISLMRELYKSLPKRLPHTHQSSNNRVIYGHRLPFIPSFQPQKNRKQKIFPTWGDVNRTIKQKENIYFVLLFSWKIAFGVLHGTSSRYSALKSQKTKTRKSSKWKSNRRKICLCMRKQKRKENWRKMYQEVFREEGFFVIFVFFLATGGDLPEG